MFLYSKRISLAETILNIRYRTSIFSCHNRKERFSPPKITAAKNVRTFLFASLRGSLTVEAAIVLPIFLFVMIAVIQYGVMMEAAVKFGTALSETGKNMAVTAYVSKYGGDISQAAELAAGALSAAYAQNQVMEKADHVSSVKNANMALSSFLAENEMIDLVLTYQIKSPFSMVKLPWNFFLQRAQVRAWVGRSAGTEGGEEGDSESGSSEMVYVTATGSVYHQDENCTYLKLSVRSVSAEQITVLRNNGGGIYHACERCGDSAGATVYITGEGNRYHSTLTCSSLKRTVKQVTAEEAAHMRACSKCGN